MQALTTSCYIVDLTGRHKTGCSRETRLVLLIPSSLCAGKHSLVVIVIDIVIITISVIGITAVSAVWCLRAQVTAGDRAEWQSYQ